MDRLSRYLQSIAHNMLGLHIMGRPQFRFISFLALFDTTSRALGVQLNCGWRRTWASHPSEDLSEPPPLRGSCDKLDPHRRCGWTEVPL